MAQAAHLDWYLDISTPGGYLVFLSNGARARNSATGIRVMVLVVIFFFVFH